MSRSTTPATTPAPTTTTFTSTSTLSALIRVILGFGTTTFLVVFIMLVPCLSLADDHIPPTMLPSSSSSSSSSSSASSRSELVRSARSLIESFRDSAARRTLSPGFQDEDDSDPDEWWKDIGGSNSGSGTPEGRATPLQTAPTIRHAATTTDDVAPSLPDVNKRPKRGSASGSSPGEITGLAPSISSPDGQNPGGESPAASESQNHLPSQSQVSNHGHNSHHHHLHHRRRRKGCPMVGDKPQYLCPSRNANRYDVCIGREQLCNRVADCPGGEDEDPKNCMFYQPVDDQLKTLAHAILLLVDNVMAQDHGPRGEL